MNQKLLRALGPTTAFLVVLISASTLTANLDTIPIIIQQRVDTIITYDMSTKKEKQEIVWSDIYNFTTIDTVTIFDSETYEEQISIVKNLLPVDRYVEMWLTEDRLLQNMANKKYYGIDTLTVFDSDTYEEFNSVYKRTHPCYYITWGNFGLNEISNHSISEIEKKINTAIQINYEGLKNNCGKPIKYSMNVIVAAPGMNAIAFNLTETNKKLPVDKIKPYIKKDARIYIHKIKINDKYKLNDVYALKVI